MGRNVSFVLFHSDGLNQTTVLLVPISKLFISRIEELEQHVISVIDIPLPVVASIGGASVQYHILSKTRQIIFDLWSYKILDSIWETLELTSLIFGFILHDMRVLYDKIIVMIEHIQNLGQIWNRFDFFYALGK